MCLYQWNRNNNVPTCHLYSILYIWQLHHQHIHCCVVLVILEDWKLEQQNGKTEQNRNFNMTYMQQINISPTITTFVILNTYELPLVAQRSSSHRYSMHLTEYLQTENDTENWPERQNRTKSKPQQCHTCNRYTFCQVQLLASFLIHKNVYW